MELRKSIGVDKDAVLLLSVGELNENKNHSVVIQALGEIVQNNKGLDLQYAIAGQGGLEAELRQLAEKCGVADRVHFLGYRDDVADWYHAADVFVHPSKREGLPVSLMEAMAARLPCLVSDIRGNADLVDKEYMCSLDDTAVFVRNICTLAQDGKKRIQIGQANAKKVVICSVQHVCSRMERIYKGMY